MSNTNNKSVFVYLFGSIVIIQMMLAGHFHIRVHVKIIPATSVFVPWLALSSFLVPNSLLFPIIPPTLYAQGRACTCCWFANYWAPGYLNLPAPPLAARWADRQRVTTGELKSPAFPAVGKLSSALFDFTKNRKQDRPS